MKELRGKTLRRREAPPPPFHGASSGPQAHTKAMPGATQLNSPLAEASQDTLPHPKPLTPRLDERESGEVQTQQQLQHYDAKRATACECIADHVSGSAAATPQLTGDCIFLLSSLEWPRRRCNTGSARQSLEQPESRNSWVLLQLLRLKTKRGEGC